jgi:hypothetical protein
MFITPMLLEKRDNPFDDEQYLFEPKIDGHRLILSMENGIVQLLLVIIMKSLDNILRCTMCQSRITLTLSLTE